MALLVPPFEAKYYEPGTYRQVVEYAPIFMLRGLYLARTILAVELTAVWLLAAAAFLLVPGNPKESAIHDKVETP